MSKMTNNSSGSAPEGYLNLTAKSLIHYFSGMGLSDFIRHNYFLKIDITENTVLEHLSSAVDFSLYPESYDEFLEQFSENIFPSANTEKIVFSLNRNILLSHYENGEYFFHNDYLLCNSANVTRQFTAFCQLFLEEGNIRALILLIDTNWFNNTSSITRAYSEFDWVTGVYQRAYGFRVSNEYLRYHSGDPAVVAALSLNDYDNLRVKYGTDVINDIIRDIHSKLKSTFGSNSILSRFSEKEFCILIINSTPDHAVKLMEKLISSKLFVVHRDLKIAYTIHIGYALYPQNSPDFAELCCFAEIALECADNPERSRLMRFDREMLTMDKNRAGFNMKELADCIPQPFLICLPKRTDAELLYANKELLRLFECETLNDLLKFSSRSPENCFYEEDRETFRTLYRSLADYPAGEKIRTETVPIRIMTKTGLIKDFSVFLRMSESSYYGRLCYIMLL